MSSFLRLSIQPERKNWMKSFARPGKFENLLSLRDEIKKCIFSSPFQILPPSNLAFSVLLYLSYFHQREQETKRGNLNSRRTTLHPLIHPATPSPAASCQANQTCSSRTCPITSSSSAIRRVNYSREREHNHSNRNMLIAAEFRKVPLWIRPRRL